MLAWLKELAVNWWNYRRTLYTLERLDRRLLADISIDRERLDEIAWKAARNGRPLSIYDLKTGRYESAGGMPVPLSPPHRLPVSDCAPHPSPKSQLKRAA